MESWHFEGKDAEEMFRQEQREQEDREKKRAEKDKPFGLLARMKATGWQAGQQLPAVDGIESDHTIDFTIIPIAKPLEWLVRPLVGLVRASWLGRVGAKGTSQVETSAFEHALNYHPRIRARGVQDPIAHNFPYSFDDVILREPPVIQTDGSLLFRKIGTLNGKDGAFELGVNPNTKTIFHRTFNGLKKMKYLTLKVTYNDFCIHDDFEGQLQASDLELQPEFLSDLLDWQDSYQHIIRLTEEERLELTEKIEILDNKGVQLAKQLSRSVVGGAKVKYFSEGKLNYLHF